MNGKYYIIIFNKNDKGDIIRHDLFEYPNGTFFYNSPIHINTNKDIIVIWACNNVEKYIDLTNLTIIPTDITNKISISTIAKGLGLYTNNITRTEKSINRFLVNIFKDYVPKFDLN
jgi:hypothetical protein